MRGVARPYARALLAVAGSLEQAVTVRDELAAFARLHGAAPQLAATLANPALPLQVKRQVLERVTEAQGLAPLTRRLLQALANRHRLGQLDAVVAGLSEELDRRRGIAVAEVASAEPLADDERQALQRVLEEKVGKRLQLRLSVDPELLAGFVARVDSQLFDGSLRGQLARLGKELAEA